MKIVAITGKRTAELRDVPDPRVRENFVRVKIHSAPMCTELKSYANGEICSCLGHEACGEVVEVAQPGKVRGRRSRRRHARLSLRQMPDVRHRRLSPL